MVGCASPIKCCVAQSASCDTPPSFGFGDANLGLHLKVGVTPFSPKKSLRAQSVETFMAWACTGSLCCAHTPCCAQESFSACTCTNPSPPKRITQCIGCCITSRSSRHRATNSQTACPTVAARTRQTRSVEHKNTETQTPPLGVHPTLCADRRQADHVSIGKQEETQNARKQGRRKKKRKQKSKKNKEQKGRKNKGKKKTKQTHGRKRENQMAKTNACTLQAKRESITRRQ